MQLRCKLLDAHANPVLRAFPAKESSAQTPVRHVNSNATKDVNTTEKPAISKLCERSVAIALGRLGETAGPVPEISCNNQTEAGSNEACLVSKLRLKRLSRHVCTRSHSHASSRTETASTQTLCCSTALQPQNCLHKLWPPGRSYDKAT